MDYVELKKHLNERFNFESYSFDEGFKKFEHRVTSCLDGVIRQPFDWRDQDGKDITVYITIINEPIAWDKDGEAYAFETRYEVHENEYGD